jgi:hypothetical protein
VVGGTSVATAAAGASVAAGGAVVAGAHAAKTTLLKTSREIKRNAILFTFSSFSFFAEHRLVKGLDSGLIDDWRFPRLRHLLRLVPDRLSRLADIEVCAILFTATTDAIFS